MQSTEKDNQLQHVDYDPFAGDALERVVPTTEPQREVWLADKLGRDASLAFNESVTLRLHGELDIAKLEAALQALVDRHDALRANLGPDGETFCVCQSQAIALERHDFSNLAANEREAVLAERKRFAVDTPFELEGGHLFRAELLRLSPDDHALLLTAHHIVCDGWSWWVLVRELAALYAAEGGTGADTLPPTEQFADYALQEATHPGGPQFAADERYWLARFANGTPVLDLPTDRPRPARRSFASLRRDFAIDKESLAAIRRMGAGCGASLFATLLAGFASTLGRVSGQDDVVVGIPAAGQSVDGHDGLVGHCVNTLPLLFELAPAQTASALVQQAQATLLDAIEHQRYTYGTLLRKVVFGRDPSRLPLVSVLFNIDQALDQASAAFPGLRMEFDSNPRSHENFEIFVNAVQTHDGLRLECQYNRDLFDAVTIDRWLSAYRCVLDGMAANPQAVAAAIPMVDDAAMRELHALQPPPTPYEHDAPVHLLFERQCDLTPDRIVVRDGQAQATYAELDARANRIANLLRNHGVHHGTLVGIALDRGIDMVAALLGVLKAGAGYVPLDPGFPAERLAYMAGDAGLAAMLTTSGHASRFDLRGRPVLALDALSHEMEAMPASRSVCRDIGPESVAYVIYTSGSTGRPKGVQVPHRAVVNFLGSMRREPGLGEDDVLVAVTTLSFDIAVLELLLPLTLGACVVIAARETAMDGGALAALLDACGATAMQATPATWRMLMETDWRGDARFKAMCGGEPLPPELAAVLLTRCGTLWNLYGPTETTVWSSCTQVLPSPGALPDTHIGRPIANTTIWIVDPAGEACPPGVPGEICIGGEGVTLGYLQRPELTSERFVPDRFSEIAAGRAPRPLYRTGDRGRWRADGNLQHLGRLDFQVKVRGYRIELGEIESLLAAHPGVAQALAIAREDRPGDVRLVAYIVPRTGMRVDEQELSTYLRSTLPDYMVPQHLMSLAAMPLLPNGKIDRKALPAPTLSARVGNAPEPPRTPLEQRIADAMAQVLGLQQVGIHDDFFALGGHSLLAAKLTTRLAKELDRTISLRTLFDGPTVARLASLLSTQETDSIQRQVVPHRADQRTAPLSPFQERIRMVESFHPGTLAYNIPSAHRFTGPLDAGLFDLALRQLADRQTVLRTAIEVRDGGAVQVVHDRLDAGLEKVEDLSHLPKEAREQELARRMRALIDEPFASLDTAPLFRARLYRTGELEHVLFFMTHHIIWDGWSFDLMYVELSAIYAALVEGKTPDLPELPVTYGDYAVWNRAWMAGPEYAAQVEYWRTHLGNARDALPTDHPRKRGQATESREIDFGLSAETVDRLQAISARMGGTIFNTLLAAYAAVLATYARQDDVVIGTLVRGRNTYEVEHLMGYFANALPLRVRVDGDAPFSSLVQATRDTLLEGFARPDLKLEDLPPSLALRNEAGSAMFYHAQVSFQDVRHRTDRWGPLRHERITVFQPGAAEDVALLMVQTHSGLIGTIVYNSMLFEHATMQAILDRFLELLQRAAIDPMRPLRQLMQDPRMLAVGESVEDAPIRADATVSRLGETVAGVSSIDAIDPRERYLSELWGEMLATVVVPSDNFFDLGGNSLQAVQMADRVARETGVRLKLMSLATLSLAQLAAELPAERQQPRKGMGALLKFLRPRTAGK